MSTPKARELGLPWSVQLTDLVSPGNTSNWHRRSEVADQRGVIVAQEGLSGMSARDMRVIAATANLVGPHLDNPRFIAAVESLSRLAAEDPERAGQVLDWIEEHV